MPSLCRREIEADVLIDDNPVYALDCATSGIHVILFNREKAYPWSKLAETHERIYEVESWYDVPFALKAIEEKQSDDARSKSPRFPFNLFFTENV